MIGWTDGEGTIDDFTDNPVWLFMNCIMSIKLDVTNYKIIEFSAAPYF